MVPSGRLNLKLICSPLLGLAPRPIDTAAGDPVGPVTVAPVSDDETEFSFRPNTVAGVSSATEIGIVAGAEIVSRPRPLPRSACWRSEITCFKPACAPLPFRMTSASATDGVSIAAPENI